MRRRFTTALPAASAVLALALALALVLPLAGGCSASGRAAKGGRPSDTTSTLPPAPPPPPLPKSPISGLEYKPEDAGPLVAVMVENHPDARPQSGLVDADLVYEALAEGGISRFMALYYGRTPKVIGPVRSARPYYVVLAKEWDAIYVHCGGDPKDREPIAQLGLADVDEIYTAGEAFWRSKERVAPHNLYTTAALARTHVAKFEPKRQLPATPPIRWEFVPMAETPVAELTIDYGWDYTVSYKYDKDSGAYRRSMNGVAHTDKETGRPIAATNILVQYVPQRVVYADGGLKMDQVGTGQGLYLAGGRVIRGTWKKADLKSPTQFLDGEGKPIALAAGQTWIQIVPTTAKVSYSGQ